MSDETNTDKTKPETDLEDAFKRWESKHELPEDVEATLVDPLDLRLGETPESALRDARRGALVRLVLMSVLTVLGVITLVWNRDDFHFFFLDEAEIHDLGDLRARWKAGERPGDGRWPEMEHNDWIRFENGIMTNERQADIKGQMVYFFFEPAIKMLVITRRQLPDKDVRAMRQGIMEASFTELQQGRWLEPGDLSATFSGQGRLFRAKDAPRRWRAVVAKYEADLQTRQTLGLQDGKPDDFWVLLDEATPRDADLIRQVIIMGCALGMMILSLIFWLRARSRVKLLEEATGLHAE